MGRLTSTLRVSVLGMSLAGVLVAPGAAVADGPGYGGTANALTVQWRIQIGTKSGGLAVYAVGFRGGSTVRLRVGASPERIVVTDSSGALRVLVVVVPPARTTPSTPIPPGATPSRTIPSTSVPQRATPSRTIPSTSVPQRATPSRTVVKNTLLTRTALAGTAVSWGVVSNVLLPRSPVRPATEKSVAVPPDDTTVLTVADDATGRLSPGTSVLVVGETPTGALRTLVGSVPPPEAGWGAPDLAPWAVTVALLGAGAFWARRRTALAAGVVKRYRHPARHRG